MYLDNLKNPIEFQGHRSKCQVSPTVLSIEQDLMI